MGAPEEAVASGIGAALYTLVVIAAIVVFLGWAIYEILLKSRSFRERVWLWQECRQAIRCAHQGRAYSCAALPSEQLDAQLQCLLAAIFLVLLWRRRPISGPKLHQKTKRRTRRYAEARRDGLSEVSGGGHGGHVGLLPPSRTPDVQRTRSAL